MQEYRIDRGNGNDLDAFIAAADERGAALNVRPLGAAVNMKATFHLLQNNFMGRLTGKPASQAFHILEKLHTLTGLSLTEQRQWEEFYRQEIGSFQSLLQLLFVLSTNWGESTAYSVHEFMNAEFMPELKRFYGFDLRSTKIALARFERLEEVIYIINQLSTIHWDARLATETALDILTSFYGIMDKSSARKEFVPASLLKNDAKTVFIYQHSSIQFWMSDRFFDRKDEDSFSSFFSIIYMYYQKSGFLQTRPAAAFPQSPLSIYDFAQACALGILPESELRQELLVRPCAAESFRAANGLLSEKIPANIAAKMAIYSQESMSTLRKTAQEVSDYVLKVELGRGDAPTNVSHLAALLEHVEGTSSMLALLEAFDKESFERLDYYYGQNLSRREIFSHLLQVCYPSAYDTAEALHNDIRENGFDEKRMVEFAVYSPQWLALVEESCDWKGLRSAAYFFHAHGGVIDNSMMRAAVETFSSIGFDDLRNGAFDINWYGEVFRELGAERFEFIFNAARCTLSGGEFARLRNNMNAVDGRENASELLAKIKESRNKDLLLSYCLAPIVKRPKAEMLLRYKYLQQYASESRNFSSQRQDNEMRTVNMGLINLAQCAGYRYPGFFAWDMETSMIKLIEPYFRPVDAEGVKVSLKINERGLPELKFVNEHRGELINIPAKLRKNKYVQTLKEVTRKVKGCNLVSPETLEQAMCDGHVFEYSQWERWLKHPVLRSMIKNTVVCTKDGETGFICRAGIRRINDEIIHIAKNCELRVAHPLVLYKMGELETYRSYFRSKSIVQAFEQVERYFTDHRPETVKLSTPYDEKFSWQADGTGGRQRVFYGNSIKATAAKNGTLSFSDRQTGRLLDTISEVPDIIFSEIMRDLYKFELILSH